MSITCKNGHQVPPSSQFCNTCGEAVLNLESQPIHALSPLENEVESVSLGACLRERYIIQRQLGQGGFGRTYLAEDMGRFREKFVIKEFMPMLRNTSGFKKAEELFQREGAILHQLAHPQIPRFWEIFREEKRIFLVLDYIAGFTYQELLEQRLRQGYCFSKLEILELLQNLLPVLSYIHQRGVIHRDISPDNIIVRNEDRLPILIDMGGVKQVAMEVGASTQLEPGKMRATDSFTRLGKVGYSPDEQILLGLVAPHSDLYALAVTILVLMTGKEPQELLNQNTLQWQWERELHLDSLLAKTINQMLASKPASRFQSADEVFQALTPLFSTTLTKEYPRPTDLVPVTFSYSSVQSGVSPTPSRLPNVSQWQLAKSKLIRRTIPRPVKLLVSGLLLMGGFGYFFWQNPGILPLHSDLPEGVQGADLQLQDTMEAIQSVPSGLFNYGGAPAFAALNSDPMKDAISRAYPDFRLRYSEPLTDIPGSSTGIDMLINGELSLAQSARPLEDEDYTKALARGFSLEQVPVAIDGVVFYVNPRQNISGLSVDQLQSIYQGKVTNWQELGGPDLPIKPIGLDPQITSALKLLLGGDGTDIGANVEVVRDFTTAIRTVAKTPGGISYASAPLAINQQSIRPVAIAKANTTDYVQPFIATKQVNSRAFQDGSYPMTRRFFIVIRRDGSLDEQAGLAYINLLLSEEGQQITEQVGYAPIR
jgi:serine/threonine protein kinase